MSKDQKKLGRPKLNPDERKEVPRQVRMPQALDLRVKAAVKAEGITISALIRRLLENWLRERDEARGESPPQP